MSNKFDFDTSKLDDKLVAHLVSNSIFKKDTLRVTVMYQRTDSDTCPMCEEAAEALDVFVESRVRKWVAKKQD